jgi:tetratricopeptide (TPR) repeat protein
LRQLAAAAVIFLLAGAARAQEDPTMAESRQHYARGRSLYLANHNEEALREFEAGFNAVPRPEFLINIGLCQMRLGHPREARDAFRKFLSAAPETHRQRKNVEDLLVSAEAAVANLPPPKEKPAQLAPVAPEPLPPNSPTKPTTAAPPPAATPAVVAVTQVSTTPARPSFARRHWWIFPVVGVVVAGVAVGLGVGLTQPTGCSAQKGLCVDASR